MKRVFAVYLVSVFLISLLGLYSVDGHNVQAIEASTIPLSFKADIYGGQDPETIEYLSDLSFHSFGGFGTNAHIFRARLRSGDEVAFAVSANDPDAFSLHIVNSDGEDKKISITNAEYSNGGVTRVSPSTLRYDWEVSREGVDFVLHRDVILRSDHQVVGQYVVQESFSIENLGSAFTLESFVEHLHLDDQAVKRDFDCDGVSETLLAKNGYSTSDYPVFGKVYEARPRTGQMREFFIDGNFATLVSTWSPVLTMQRNSSQEILTARYITSTAKNHEEAYVQIAADSWYLLHSDNPPERYFVRSYNTDDAGGVFVNGLMVAGSMYKYYPDSGWQCINPFLRPETGDVLSFASWDAGVCCGSTWGFDIKREDRILWSETGSGSTTEGIRFAEIVEMTANGEFVSKTQDPPSIPIAEEWYVQVRALGGSGFILVDNLPVAGSTWNQARWVEVSELLGTQENHLHSNAWNDGRGVHEYYFAIRRGEEIVWENEGKTDDSPRGRSHHLHLVIDENGQIYPLLDLPVDYQSRMSGARDDFIATFSGSRITSMFDHRYPNYNKDGYFLPYTGIELSDPADVDCIFGHNCYDGHDAYDLDDLCSDQAPCSAPFAVYPAADGEIIEEDSGWDAQLGCRVTIDHGDGWKTVYAHLADAVTSDNERCDRIAASGTVDQFTRIGEIGCTGGGCEDDRAHLHFMVQKDDVVVDPSGWAPDPLTNPDPWEELNGVISYPMWLHSITSDQNIGIEGGTISSTSREIDVSIPSEYYDQPLHFSLSFVPVTGISEGLVNSAYSFSISARDESGNAVTQLDEALLVKVNFDKERLKGLKEKTLSLYIWDFQTASWNTIPTTLDIEGAIASATTNQLSLIALMGEPLNNVYLPITLDRK